MEPTQNFIIDTENFSGGIIMDITRRNFVKLATAGGLILSTGRVFAATNEKILIAYFSIFTCTT